MKKFVFLIIFLVVVGVSFFIGCSTKPDVARNIEEEKQVEKEKPEKKETVQPKEEKVEEEKKPVEEKEEEKTEEKTPPQEETFTVTEELFNQTFDDIEKIIKELNKIIASSDFDKWKNYLAPDYIEHYSKRDVLREISDRPVLKKYNIRLTNLEDYFKYVVVPSRSNTRLDDLVFEDDNHVKAIMIIDDQRAILYQLAKINNNWKITK